MLCVSIVGTAKAMVRPERRERKREVGAVVLPAECKNVFFFFQQCLIQQVSLFFSPERKGMRKGASSTTSASPKDIKVGKEEEKWAEREEKEGN